MIKQSIKKLPLLAFALSLSAFALTAQAHEFRELDINYAIGIGSHDEPPLAGVANGVDFIPIYHQGGPNGTPIYLDRTKGDKVNIVVTPIKLAYEAFNAPITNVYSPLFNFVQNVVEENPAYTASVTYPSAGTIGYYVFGEIQKKGKPKKSFAFTKFVCGAGSQDIPNSSFDCVQ